MNMKNLEKALEKFPNRFQLTMMAAARAKELTLGDRPMLELDEDAKPVVAALAELAEGKLVPASKEEMEALREIRRKAREEALQALREKEMEEFLARGGEDADLEGEGASPARSEGDADS